MNTIECPLCGRQPETIDHLFLQCTWSWELWKKAMGWWGVVSCCNASITGWMDSWAGLCPSKSRSRAWNLVFFVVVWTIWEMRNDIVFNGKNIDQIKSLDSIKFRVVWWFKNFGCGSTVDTTLLLLDVEGRCVDSKLVKVGRPSSWSPPVDNDLLFNVDGSVHGNSRLGGIGGVLRNAVGRFYAFSLRL